MNLRDKIGEFWSVSSNESHSACFSFWLPLAPFLARSIWASRLCEVIKSGGSVRQNAERSEGQNKKDEGCRRRGEWILDRTFPSIQMHIVCIWNGIVGLDWYWYTYYTIVVTHYSILLDIFDHTDLCILFWSRTSFDMSDWDFNWAQMWMWHDALKNKLFIRSERVNEWLHVCFMTVTGFRTR